jgi:hypothetical protein
VAKALSIFLTGALIVCIAFFITRPERQQIVTPQQCVVQAPEVTPPIFAQVIPPIAQPIPPIAQPSAHHATKKASARHRRHRSIAKPHIARPAEPWTATIEPSPKCLFKFMC